MNFYVNPEKRTTVAVMTDVQSDAFDYICALVKNRDSNTRQGVYAGDILRSMVRKNMPNVLRAKAKCAPQDDFFEDVGTELARARLLCKYYNHCFAIILKYKAYIDEHVEDRLLMAIDSLVDRCTQYGDLVWDILDATEE